jgi:hypothetical protein
MLLLAVAAALLVPSGGSARSQSPPTVNNPPMISGTAVQGNTLNTSNGSWIGSGITFQYRWLRCDTTGGGINGVDCATIPGETRKAYVLTGADVGHRIRSRVIATNKDGTASSNSAATSVVKANGPPKSPPKNAVPPTISGTPAEKSMLTANKGTWTGTPTIRYAYQWRRCDQNGGSCSSIGSATASTYTLTSVDVGNTLRVRVTATNAQGSATATSAPTAVISKAEPPPGGVISINNVSLPNRLIIDQRSFEPNRLRSHGQRIIVRVHVSDSRNRSVIGALVFVEGIPEGQVSPRHVEQPTGPDGYANFNLRATSRLQLRASNIFVFFLRARKEGEDPLGGVTARRLVGVPLG